MNKSCARCSKTVYPIEELKCLDKVSYSNIYILPFRGTVVTIILRNFCTKLQVQKNL